MVFLGLQDIVFYQINPIVDMFCCGGNEEEPHGPPASHYAAPPKGAKTYGGGGSSFYSLFPMLVFIFLELLASVIEI